MTDSGNNRNARPRRRLKRRWLALPAALLFLQFGVLLFADEIARAVTGAVLESPVELPPGTEIRVAPRLTRLIGAPSGGAAAVTLGHTIIVPHVRFTSNETRGPRMRRDTMIVSERLWREIIRHERTHVAQRERYGRWYLPVYIAWYIRHGYRGHPLEREAWLETR